LGPILYCNSSFQEYAIFCILGTIKELHGSDKIVRMEIQTNANWVLINDEIDILLCGVILT
jgi:hypothetical protein